MIIRALQLFMHGDGLSLGLQLNLATCEKFRIQNLNVEGVLVSDKSLMFGAPIDDIKFCPAVVEEKRL